jgi:hypothetical protein
MRLTHARRLLTHLDILALLVGEVAEDREDGEAADEADACAEAIDSP